MAEDSLSPEFTYQTLPQNSSLGGHLLCFISTLCLFLMVGYIFKARLGYRKDRSVFPHLGRTWWGGAIQGPSPPVPVHVGRLARIGPQRLCQPLHHSPALAASTTPTAALHLRSPGVGPIGTHLGHRFLLRLLPQTHLLLFMRPQLSPLRSPTCHQPWPVPASMATPAPGAFQSLLHERRQEGTVPSGAGGGAMKRVSPSQASSAPLTRQKTLACCWRVSLASGTTDVQRAQ